MRPWKGARDTAPSAQATPPESRRPSHQQAGLLQTPASSVTRPSRSPAPGARQKALRARSEGSRASRKALRARSGRWRASRKAPFARLAPLRASPGALRSQCPAPCAHRHGGDRKAFRLARKPSSLAHEAFCLAIARLQPLRPGFPACAQGREPCGWSFLPCAQTSEPCAQASEPCAQAAEPCAQAGTPRPRGSRRRLQAP